MTWALEVKGINIPWEEAAAIVHPGATGEAFKQAMSKLRAKRLKEGLPVPPVRPGKEKSRQDCEVELKRILDGAREVREAKNAGRPPNAGPKNASDDYDGGDEETPPTVSQTSQDPLACLTALSLPVSCTWSQVHWLDCHPGTAWFADSRRLVFRSKPADPRV